MAPVVPEKLQWWRETPEGAAWLDRLPRLIAECAEQSAATSRTARLQATRC